MRGDKALHTARVSCFGQCHIYRGDNMATITPPRPRRELVDDSSTLTRTYTCHLGLLDMLIDVSIVKLLISHTRADDWTSPFVIRYIAGRRME